MANYSLYNTRINQYGNTKRERLINIQKDFLNRKLPNHPSTKNVKINDVERSLVIISTENAYIKKIISLPDESFEAGQIVNYKSENWLIIESDLDNEIQSKGRMILCPNILKFQNLSGKILSYPYYVDTNYISLSENKTITTSDTSRKIILPFDHETKQLFIGKRFMGEVFNNVPQVWKVIELDSASKKGLLIVTLEKDEFNSELDNIELEICNYFAPSPPSPVSDAKISYVGLPEIKIGGSTKTFKAVFPFADIEAIWNVVLPSGYEDQFVITQNGTFIGIQAKDNIVLDGMTIELNLSSQDGSYSTSLEIKVVKAI